jgi:glycosyltransferase involved in cell wall biosynthesis
MHGKIQRKDNFEMKVLMITPSFSPILGGCESAVQSLALKLNENGIHTDVMTFNMDEKWNPVWREEAKEDIFKIFRIPAFNIFHKTALNPLAIAFNIRVIPKPNFTKRLRDYDILHFHDDADLSFPFFSYFVKRPKILHCHSLSGSYLHYRNYLTARKILTGVVDSYICVSSYAKKLLLNLGLPESKIWTLYNSIDTEKLKPNKSKKLDNLILFIGRVAIPKGLHVLLNSLKYLDTPVHLIIIGPKKEDAKYFEKIRVLIEKQKKRGVHEIEFLGPLPNDKLAEWYQKATIFVCPSLKETLGIVNLEALSCETPVVASKTGGITEIVKHDVNGILVPPNDPKKLANALRKLLEDKELREKYGKRGRRIVQEQFSLDHTSKELVKIYEDILR